MTTVQQGVTKNAEICSKNLPKMAVWNLSLCRDATRGALENFYMDAQPHSFRHTTVTKDGLKVCPLHCFWCTQNYHHCHLHRFDNLWCH